MISSQTINSKKLHSPDYKEKYKTELCRNWLNGYCSFDNKCVFAHGKDDLREKTINFLEEVNNEELQESEDDLSPQSMIKKRLPVFVELSSRISKESNLL